MKILLAAALLLIAPFAAQAQEITKLPPPAAVDAGRVAQSGNAGGIGADSTPGEEDDDDEDDEED
jgi:parvulin-like peptidyl-prolyl isomerase